MLERKESFDGAITLAAALSGNSGIGPGFALADDASRSKAAPAIGATSSSPESIEAGGAAGCWGLGLMLRCGREGVEAVVVVVEPFPPHVRPQITLRTPGQESQFTGTIIPS